MHGVLSKSVRLCISPLMAKMCSLDLHASLIRWFNNYLADRTQVVIVNGSVVRNCGTVRSPTGLRFSIDKQGGEGLETYYTYIILIMYTYSHRRVSLF